ncbi:hypothetical protein ACFX13_030291 [Malus domestica]
MLPPHMRRSRTPHHGTRTYDLATVTGASCSKQAATVVALGSPRSFHQTLQEKKHWRFVTANFVEGYLYLDRPDFLRLEICFRLGFDRKKMAFFRPVCR